MGSFFPGLCASAPHGFVFLTSNNKSVSESVCWRCLLSDRKASIAYTGCPCQQLTNPAPAPDREARGWARGPLDGAAFPAGMPGQMHWQRVPFWGGNLLKFTLLTPFRGKTPPVISINSLIRTAQAAGSSTEGWHCSEPGDGKMLSFGYCRNKHEPASRTAAESFLES